MNRGDPNQSGVVAAGNFIVDCVKLIDHWPEQDSLARIFHQTLSNGGGPYNVLKNLARLGARYPLSALGRIGDDSHGAWIREDCRTHGIATDRLLFTTGASTSYTDVMTIRGSARRTFFHQAGANAALTASDLSLTGSDCGSSARIFYLGYLLLLPALDALETSGRPAAYAVLQRAREAGMCTVLDCVSEASDRFGSVVRPVLPQVDILFANDFEAERLTGRRIGRGPDLDRDAMAAAACDLLHAGVHRTVIIHAPEITCAASSKPHDVMVWQPAVALPADQIAGTSGAGDALAAGFLHAWHEGWSLAAALELGVCTAAASLRHAGCSEGVDAVDACLALAQKYGYREVPPAPAA